MPADPANLDDMVRAFAGAACVVSALNGVGEVIIERQGVLLDAAVKAGVPRFIPSDHSGMRWTSVPQHLSGLRETKGRDDQPGA